MPSPRRLTACLFAAALAVAGNALGYSATAGAERVWDIESYDMCLAGLSHDQMNDSIADQKLFNQKCCESSGGVFVDDGYIGKCVAPPAEESQGTRQLPGNIRIPPDLGNAPVLTQEPPPPVSAAG